MTSPGGDRDWLAAAACRDLDPQPFTDPHDDADTRHAKATCAACPVRTPCRDAGLALHPRADVGIWGGTTVAERREIRRDAAAATQTAPAVTGDTQRPPPTPGPRWIRTVDGDYTDPAGRTIITKLPTGDWMTLIDDRPIARTDTLVEAKRATARILTDGEPKQPVTRTSDGDHVDPSGRTIITKLPTGDWMTLVDHRPVARTATLARGQQAAFKTLLATSPLRPARARSLMPSRR